MAHLSVWLKEGRDEARKFGRTAELLGILAMP